MNLVFATNNLHKVREVQDLLGNKIRLLSLKDIGCFDEIPESHPTLEENASEKSRYIYDRYHVNCFADDTGLEVEALNGEPGVYSARYAGEDKNPAANIRKVQSKLKNHTNRNARFRTVISLIIDGTETFFEGSVNGTIIETGRGDDGFGYDPVFLPDGYNLTFGEMPLPEKNKISHRAIAIQKITEFLLKNIVHDRMDQKK